MKVESEIFNLSFTEKIHRSKDPNLSLEERYYWSQTTLSELWDFFNNAPCGFHSLNAEGILTRINQTELDWLGLDWEAVGTLHRSAMLSPKSQAAFAPNFKKLKTEGHIENIEAEYVRSDSSILPVLVNAKAVYDSEGQYIGSHTTVLDLTEQKRISHELAELYQSAPCGYFDIDSNFNITRINQTALDWLGYTEGELLGQPYTTFVASKVLIPMDVLMTHKRIGNLERDLVRKDGSVFPSFGNILVMTDEAGRFAGIRSTFFDITEKKKMEAELRQTNEELYHANQDKNRFIGIASHDLQSPITAIDMSAEILQKNAPNLSEIQKKLLNSIRAATARMNYLVQNILNINRIERGMVSNDWRTVNLKTMLWDITSRNQVFAQRKNIIIHQLVPDNVDWNIRTEPNYLTQAVENLVNNAIKFSPKGKNIRLSLEKITDKEESFKIIVADEGQGIKEEDMPRLFGRFQKLSARPTDGEVSTGLGLSVSKEFIEQIGGRIICQSIWGLGTTFTIWLPMRYEV
jgi:PAS domain S-box-containing protein